MSFLEKKIKDNTDFFDDQHLADGHKKRFLDRLQKHEHAEVQAQRWPGIMRIAAIILVLVGSYFVLRNISVSDIGDAVFDGVTVISFAPEIENVFAYYDALSQQKVAEIGQRAPNDVEAERVKLIAQKQLQNLDANLVKIEKEYAKNPNNTKLKAALVNNKRKKAEILDDILKQLDEASTFVSNQPFTNSTNTNP